MGAPDSGVALRRLQGGDCGPRSAGEMYAMRQYEAGAGYRRARHLVFVRPAAVYHAGLAGKDARPGSFLSDDATHYRVRDPVLLGGAHDHVWLPLHGGTQTGSGDQESERVGGEEERQRSVPRGLHPRPGARCRSAEDVEDQGECD